MEDHLQHRWAKLAVCKERCKPGCNFSVDKGYRYGGKVCFMGWLLGDGPEEIQVWPREGIYSNGLGRVYIAPGLPLTSEKAQEGRIYLPGSVLLCCPLSEAVAVKI